MKDEFIACGLTTTEYEVLMHLLARNARTAGVIARALDLKRSTVYSALQGLEARKLVMRGKKGGAAEFAAAPAEEIPALLLNQARLSFDSVLSNVKLIEPRIMKFQKGNLFNAGEIEINHIDNNRDYFSLIGKYVYTQTYCAVWNPQVAISSPSVKQWMSDWATISARHKNKIRDILVDGPKTRWYLSQIKNPNYEFRLVADGDGGLADLVIANEIVILSLNSPGTECAIEIRNSHYARFMKWYFEELWDRLEPQNNSQFTKREE